MKQREGDAPPGNDPRAARPNGPVQSEDAQPRPAETAAEESVAVDAMADLEATLENVRAELAQMNDRFLRLAAEFDNYRKRTERERTELWGRAQADIVTRLLDAVDDLSRVAAHGATGSPAALLEGAQLVDKKLRTVLQAAGLERIEPLAEPFDPASMEALATLPAEHPEEDEVVADVFQPGYRFKGQLLRAARVRVKKFEA
jgi:molecular chaperone GrpE